MQQNVNYQKELEKVIGSLGGKRPRLLLHACCAPCSSYCLEYLREYFDITVFYYNPNITVAAEYAKREAEEKRLIKTYNMQVENQDFGSADRDQGKQADECSAGENSGKQADECSAGENSGKQADECSVGMDSTSHAGIIHIVDAEYDPERYLEAVKGLENEPEGGARCARCFELRLRRTMEEAVKLDMDYVTTTLTISPLKNAVLLNSIGMRLAEEYSHKNADDSGSHEIMWLPSDFKKKGGFQRSIDLSHKFGLYRQNYCGCTFSRRDEQDGRN